MRFEYHIGIDEYISGSLAYWKLSDRRGRFGRGIFWALAGACLILIARVEDPLFQSVVIVVIGALWIYAALRSLFPQSYLSRCYQVADLDDRKFTADINEHGFEVTTGSWSWRVPWQGIRFKAEDERVFMVYSFGTMFIFGKKYLTPEQQQEIRKFLGM